MHLKLCILRRIRAIGLSASCADGHFLCMVLREGVGGGGEVCTHSPWIAVLYVTLQNNHKHEILHYNCETHDFLYWIEWFYLFDRGSHIDPLE